MWREAICLAITIALCVGCRTTAQIKTPLTTVAAVRALSPDHLREGHEVRIDGVVVYREARARLLIAGDGKDSILVDPLDVDQPLSSGEKVKVSGYTGYQNFAPVIVKARVHPQPGEVQLQARQATIEDLLAGQHEHQWTKVAARLVSFSPWVFDRHRVVFSSGDRSLNGVVLLHRTGVLDRLVGKEVTVFGVPIVRRSPSGDIHEVELMITSAYDLQSPSTARRDTTPQQPNFNLPEITSIGQLKRLTPSEASKRYPVRIRGTTTVSVPQRTLMMIHDGTQGLYIYPMADIVGKLSLGEQVEISGFSDPGGFAPAIIPMRVTSMGTVPLPRPTVLSPETALSPELDNAWVSVTGIVRSVSARYPILRVSFGHLLVEAEVLDHSPADLHKLVDARVEMRGVWSPVYDTWRQLRGFRLLIASADLVRPVEYVKPHEGVRPISLLRGFERDPSDIRRVRVEGIVTASRLNGQIWIEDKTGAVELELANPTEYSPRPGAIIRATGLLPPAFVRSVLDQVTIEPGDNTFRVAPLKANANECVSGALDARLVKIEGYISDVYQELGDIVLTARSGRNDFRALLETPSRLPDKDLRVGSLAEFTGVCNVRWNAERQPPRPESMELILRSREDITILHQASWWTRENTLLVLAGLAGVTLVVTMWMLLLRRQVGLQATTMRVQLQREADLKVQLEQARRMESLGRLAGGVAHDFNNLLTVILGYAQDVLDDLRDPDHRESMNQVIEAGGKAAALTRQLLAYSRKQALQPVVIDLNQEIRRATPLLERAIDESVQLTLHLKPDLPRIKVDPSQLHQVLINLVANARDAMPAGGRISIGTSDATVDKEEARRSQLEPGAYVRLTITDTGTGMDEQTKARVFEPFFTTKPTGKGVGLGLATVYGIVKQSGGHIWVYSEPGMGTVFKVQFPATQEPVPPPPAPPKAAAKGSGRSILLVEDRDDVRHLTAQMLRESGFTVTAAASGEHALEVVNGNAKAFDLLLVDAVLPGMNGRQVAEAVTERIPSLKVLFMSGYTEDVIVTRGQLTPGIRLLEKPFTREQLLRQVEETLGAGTDVAVHE